MFLKYMLRSFALVVGLLVVLFAVDALVHAQELVPATPISLTIKNTITLRGAVTEESVGRLVTEFQLHEGQDVYFYLTSPGGDIFAGLHLIDQMRAHTGKITCITDMSISMAFVIFQACPNRLVLEHGVLMQHEAAYGLRQDRAPNNLSLTVWLTGVLRKMDVEQAVRLGITYEVFKLHTITDWWMDGPEAIQNKAADGLTRVVCDKGLVRKHYTESVTLMFATAELEWSSCPLVHAPEKITIKPTGQMMEGKAATEVRDYLDALNYSPLNRDRVLAPLRQFNRIR